MMAVTQSFLASLLRLLRDIPATLEAANAAIAICDDQGFAFWHAQAAVDRGWAITMQGHPSAGIKEAELALVARRSGSEAGAGGVTAKLVDACLHARKTRQGLHVVAEALTSETTQYLDLWRTSRKWSVWGRLPEQLMS